MSINEKMKRLEDARSKVDEISRKKERLGGQLEEKQKQQAELEAQCRTEYNCEVSELPEKIEALDIEATESLKKAEQLLQVKEDDVL